MARFEFSVSSNIMQRSAQLLSESTLTPRLFDTALTDVFPCASDEGGHLLAVGIAHFFFGIYFGRALVRTYFHYLELHSKLGKHVLIEHRL